MSYTSETEDLQTLLSRCSGLLKTHRTLTYSAAPILSQSEEEEEEEKSQQQSDDHRPPTLLSANLTKQTPRSQGRSQDDSMNKCMILVFQYLTIPELCQVGLVCKTWYQTAHHPMLWEHVTLSDCSLTSQTLVTLATHCTRTKHIKLQGLTPPPSTPLQDLQGYLKEQKGGLEVGLKILLNTCSSNLLSLSISHCPLILTESCLWIISTTCPHLHSFSYHSNEFPPTPESVWSLSNGCRGIQSLHLYPSQDPEIDSNSYTNKCLYHISQGFPLLTQLTVGGAGITLNAILQLASSVKQLSYLHLINGPDINLSVAKKMASSLPLLDSFLITHTPVSPHAVIKIIDTHPSLQLVKVTVSFTDYYCEPSELNNMTSINKFQKIISNFKTISQHEYYSRIFTMSIKPVMTTFGYQV